MAGETKQTEEEILEPVVVNPGKEARPTMGNPIDAEKKDRAFEMLFRERKTVPTVCRELGIVKGTIEQWLVELKEEKRTQYELEDMMSADLFEAVKNQLLLAINKDKIEKASVKDLLIAAGIATDKRRELIGPKKGGTVSRLRVAWKNGSGEGGAVEVETE